MHHKAGTVFDKRFEEFFNINDHAHLLAYFQFQKTGEWPHGFLKDVWFSRSDWEAWIQRELAQQTFPADFSKYVEEYDRICDMLTCYKSPIKLEPFAGKFVIFINKENDNFVPRLIIEPFSSTETINSAISSLLLLNNLTI